MGNGCSRRCTKCCGKVQDWCRDSCGCCPCKCCKTVKVEVTAQQTIEHKIEKKQIPFGRSEVYSGIRMTNNTYTSPVLEVYRWKRSETQTITKEAVFDQRVALGGMQTERDNADRHLGPLRGTERVRKEIDQEVIVIPVECIISIKSSSEIKEGHTEFQHVVLKAPSSVRLSCCQKIGRWCNTTFCCCCDDSKVKVHTGPEEIVKTISNEVAERKILITIEHIHYSNIHTPSHVRVLSTSDQAAFYKENLGKDILQFYLLDNSDLERTDFDLKQKQASALCRLVMQLKSMIGHYPDGQILQQIIDQHGILFIGDPPKETMGRLVGPGTINTSLEVAAPGQAITNFIGDPLKETMGRLVGPGTINTSLKVAVPVQAITNSIGDPPKETMGRLVGPGTINTSLEVAESSPYITNWS